MDFVNCETCGVLTRPYKLRGNGCTACTSVAPMFPEHSFDRAPLIARPGELRCARCGEWLPDDAFWFCHGNRSRRDRYSYCRACERQRGLKRRRAVSPAD